MNVLITGKYGQLGSELLKRIPKDVAVSAFDADELDITSAAQIAQRVHGAGFDYVINCAAFTAVDKAETDEKTARNVNVEGTRLLATACSQLGARLVQISTDFVFTDAHSSPIAVDAQTDPAGVYATTKRDAEDVAREILGDQCAVVRTSWLYAASGSNFVKTMIRLMNERDELGVVSDQIGTPTWAGTLADSLWRLIAQEDIGGTWHVTDAGVASWYDFAVAIYEDASAFGMIESECVIRPIRTSDYPTPAQRPTFSVLDKSRAWDAEILDRVHWRTTMRTMLGDLLDAEQAELSGGR